ncbi:MAG TPA: PadR family transcriptional regulator [Vicinamibacterales bacterium]|nr:PadR family transcriptional regulator [Vicinamibacterales bacterium]
MSRRRTDNAAGDLLGGTLDMLILQTLRLAPANGFTIAKTIEQRSDAILLVEEGSLYPALHRLEKRGWITSSWGITEHKRRARFYRLTAAGKRSLVQETSRWERLVLAVGRVIRPVEG